MLVLLFVLKIHYYVHQWDFILCYPTFKMYEKDTVSYVTDASMTLDNFILHIQSDFRGSNEGIELHFQHNFYFIFKFTI